MLAARELVDGAAERAESRTKELDASEKADLARGLGVENPSRPPKWAGPQFKELGEVQKKRAKRAARDELDRDLLDLMSFYRDLLAAQSRANVELVNAEMSREIELIAAAGSPESAVRSMEAIVNARERIDANVAPLLAVEELLLGLKVG